MKKSLFFSVIILFLISLQIGIASACVNITIPKSNYLPGETFQAEITGTFSQSLSSSNVYFLRNNEENLIYFNLIQISKEKYVLYTDLPSSSSDSIGSWSLEIRNVLCSEDKVLKAVTKKINFSVSQPLTDSFLWLSFQVRGKWPVAVDEDAFALLALSDDAALASEGKTALLGKSSNEECWPSSGCNVKSTALALLALKNSTDNITKNKIIDWLSDAQNNIKGGLWDIIMNSSSNGTCVLSLNNVDSNISVISGQNLEPLTYKFPSSETINVSLNCSNLTLSNVKIIHTFMGKISEFPLQEGKQNFSVFSTNLNNKKCWGNGYREECNAASTAFAVFALKSLNAQERGVDVNDALSWLTLNSQTTFEKSVVFLFSKESSLETWLLNNQAPNGFWSTSSIALNNKEDIQSTVFALYSLINSGQQNIDAINRAKIWLQENQKNNFNNSVLYESMLLSFIFPMSQLEPIMSIKPAVIKTLSNRVFSITLTNKGITSLNVSLSSDELGINQNFILESGEYKTATPQIPARTENIITNLDIDYKTIYGVIRKYNVPMIILASGMENQLVDVTNTSLLPNNLVFLEAQINKSILNDKDSIFEIHLKNNAKTPLNNISLTPSLGIYGIINIENSSLDTISSGENRTIVLNVSAGATPNTYNGEIKAETLDGLSVSLPVTLIVTSKISNITIPNKATTGTTPPAGKQSQKIFGIIMIIIAVLVIAFFFMNKLKKKKPVGIGEVIEKIEEKYKK